MRTIYLVRHGKPEFPGGKKCCIGWTDLPLSLEGRNQIEALAEQFAGKEIEKIYTSPLKRCVESARILSDILSGGRIPVETVPDLREIHMGDWEGMTFSRIREQFPAEYEKRGRDIASYCPPGGESFLQCQKRASEAFARIQKETRGNVIVMAHAGVNRTLIAAREGIKLRDLLTIPQEYGAAYGWEEYIFDAMISAAGMSSRMGDYKPLMDLAGKKVICRQLDMLRRGGAREIVIITGNRAEELMAAAKGPDVHFIHNPYYETTKMFDSVRLGLQYFEDKKGVPGGQSPDGIFFLPVDVPLFTEFTMEYEKYRFKDGAGDVYCPYHGGASGHPILIRTGVLAKLLAHDGERGLRGACEKLGDRFIPLDVPDGGMLMDADTKEDFARLLAYEAGRSVPDEETCLSLLAWFQVPDHTVRHCRAVAELAVRIGEACIGNGAALDLDLIRGAALLHDLAKGQPEHDKDGARWLRLLGHEKTAEVVEDHMNLPEEKQNHLNESLVVYLADKMVCGDRQVTVEERFAPKREMFRDNPEALSHVEKRYRIAAHARELAAEGGYKL